MPTIKLIGILTDVFPVENINPNFCKKAFWVKQPGTERYPNHWEFELHQQDTGRLKGFEIGDTVEAEVEIHGRKWNGQGKEKIFITLKCVGLAKVKAIEAPGFKPKAKPGREAGNFTGDLPF